MTLNSSEEAKAKEVESSETHKEKTNDHAIVSHEHRD